MTLTTKPTSLLLSCTPTEMALVSRVLADPRYGPNALLGGFEGVLSIFEKAYRAQTFIALDHLTVRAKRIATPQVVADVEAVVEKSELSR